MTTITPTSKNISRSLLFVSAFIFTSVIMSAPSEAKADALYRQLGIGSSGPDVSILQTFLAGDSSLYPEGLVTNYFGTMTAAAVSKFQTRNNIPSVGYVGPVTLSALNKQISTNTDNTDVSAPVVSNVKIAVNSNTANISWNTNELSYGTLYYSTTPLSMYEQGRSVIVDGTRATTGTSLRDSPSITISGLQPDMKYYYIISSVDAFGNVNITWPATFLTAF